MLPIGKDRSNEYIMITQSGCEKKVIKEGFLNCHHLLGLSVLCFSVLEFFEAFSI